MSDRTRQRQDEAELDLSFSALLKRAFQLPAAPAVGDPHAPRRCSHCGATVSGRRALCPTDGHPLGPAGDPRVGELVAERYRVLERLGGGGVGTVYRARHRSLGREVAVKYLRPELAHQPEHRARLEREAHIIGHLDDEHIVGVVDHALAANGSPVLIMEYLRGETLAQAIARGRFSARRTTHVARQIAGALSRAHRLGVLHRDIKPSNLLLCPVTGDRDFVKLLDFGIARSSTTLDVTRSHEVVGTPQYMSPEQSNREPLGPASDLYSLGCVMYEMLLGRPPFDGAPAKVLHAHVYEPPPSLAGAGFGIAPALAEIVERLLQKRPEARYRDAHQLLLALDRVAAQLTGRPSAPAEPAPLDLAGFAVRFEEPLEHRLGERLAHLQRAAAERFGAPPGAMARGLRDVARAFESVRTLRARLSTIVAEAEQRQREPRERSLRLRGALQTLMRDAAAAEYRVQTLRERQARRFDQQRARLQALGRSVTAPVREGERLSAARAQALDELLAAVASLADDAARVDEAASACMEGEQALDDLRFQIDQLKGRVAGFEAEVRGDMDAVHAEATAVEARYRSALEAAATGLDELVRQWPSWQDVSA